MNNKKKTLTHILTGIVVFIIAAIIIIGKDTKTVPVGTPEPTTTAQPPTNIANEYETVDRQDSQTTENHYYLLKTSDLSEENIQRIARQIKQKECKKQCNLFLYDDEQAAQLDMAYNQLTTSEAMTDWKESNYVYVAEHNIGQVINDEFSYYPLKDWYYEQMKEK